ncbi:MAG: hypothetical protein SGJ20_22360 [Planctomycetota bacterium]|nr:hypothetical protein [Planctomycetota bacterium]
MKCDEFVEGLRLATPSEESLRAIGRRPLTIESWRKCYRCVPRNSTLSIPKNIDEHDQLVKLIAGWDLSTVEIGQVLFATELEKTEFGVPIGRHETCRIFLPDDGGPLLEREFGIETHVLCQVAASSENYLHMLHEYAVFLAKVALKESSYDDMDECERVAARCIELAGGEEYTSFCRGLFGI